MQQILFRIWSLPWPARLRRPAEKAIDRMWLQRVLFPQFLVGVVGIVRNERGELLLLRHTYRHGHPWGLPTGFLERREQPSTALQREIREETGFEVELSPVWQVYAETDRPLLNIVFRGTYAAGDFASSEEVSAARFFPFDALPPVLPDQRRLLDTLAKD